MVAGGYLHSLKIGRLAHCLLLAALAVPASADLWHSMEQGQSQQVLQHLRAEFAQLGLELPEELRLEQHRFDEPLSFYRHETQTIRLSSLLTEAAQGPRYWQAWSDIFSASRWLPGPQFDGAADMQRAANFTLLGILAHEMGHCADRHYGILEQRWNRQEEPPPSLRELVADELAITLLRRLTARSQGQQYLDQYQRVVLHSLRTSAPADRQVLIPAQESLWDFASKVQVQPQEIDRYCGYQLSRQQRLLHTFEGPSEEQLQQLAARRRQQFEQQAPWLPGERWVHPYPQSSQPTLAQGWPWSPSSDAHELLWKGPAGEGPERVRLEPLSDFVAHRGWRAPTKISRAYNHFQYLWDLHPQPNGSTLGLVVNRHRLTGAPATAASDIELFLVEWAERQPLKVLSQWTLPDHPNFTAALKVSPGGRRRLWVAHAQLTAYEPQASSWSPCDALPLDSKPGWLRASLMDDQAQLVWADDSRILRSNGSATGRLAGSFWRGTASGNADGQVCFQPELLRLENAPGGAMRVLFRNRPEDTPSQIMALEYR